MKSAEEIADDVIEQCWEQTELSKPVSAKKILAQALTAYADEKLEEAARFVGEIRCRSPLGSNGPCGNCDGCKLAKAIRALKSTPAPGGAKVDS